MTPPSASLNVRSKLPKLFLLSPSVCLGVTWRHFVESCRPQGRQSHCSQFWYSFLRWFWTPNGQQAIQKWIIDWLQNEVVQITIFDNLVMRNHYFWGCGGVQIQDFKKLRCFLKSVSASKGSCGGSKPIGSVRRRSDYSQHRSLASEKKDNTEFNQGHTYICICVYIHMYLQTCSFLLYLFSRRRCHAVVPLEVFCRRTGNESMNFWDHNSNGPMVSIMRRDK